MKVNELTPVFIGLIGVSAILFQKTSLYTSLWVLLGVLFLLLFLKKLSLRWIFWGALLMAPSAAFRGFWLYVSGDVLLGLGMSVRIWSVGVLSLGSVSCVRPEALIFSSSKNLRIPLSFSLSLLSALLSLRELRHSAQEIRIALHSLGVRTWGMKFLTLVIYEFALKAKEIHWALELKASLLDATLPSSYAMGKNDVIALVLLVLILGVGTIGIPLYEKEAIQALLAVFEGVWMRLVG